MSVETKAAVADPETEGIEYIDERDGENNNVERKVTQMEMEDESREEEEGVETLHINRVNVRKGPRGEERARLRVSVEITHPALKLPVHRTWTGTVLHCLSYKIIQMYYFYTISHTGLSNETYTITLLYAVKVTAYMN